MDNWSFNTFLFSALVYIKTAGETVQEGRKRVWEGAGKGQEGGIS